MKMQAIIGVLSTVGMLHGLPGRAAEVTLHPSLAAGGLRLQFELAPGTTGHLQQSSNLVDWADTGGILTGAAGLQELTIGPLAAPRMFYRLGLTSSDVAPEVSQFRSLIVGTVFAGYEFTSATRFNWRGEGGNWAYTKTGPGTGLLVLTYDEDGNDPATYREEMKLTFATPTTGTYRYAEYWMSLEIPSSVTTGAFSL